MYLLTTSTHLCKHILEKVKLKFIQLFTLEIFPLFSYLRKCVYFFKPLTPCTSKIKHLLDHRINKKYYLTSEFTIKLLQSNFLTAYTLPKNCSYSCFNRHIL